VYVDSPLAAEATAIFMQCNPVCFDDETLALIKEGINPIWFDDIRMSITSEESKQINSDSEPKVIISSSGMCEAGRIRHHLKHNLWRADSIILFVGYQSEGSLGRKLLDRAKSVRLFTEEITVNAEICSLHGSSGHADQAGLIRWIEGYHSKPNMVFVNHGEDDACETFRHLLLQKGYNAVAPYSGTEYDLITGEKTVHTEGKPVINTKIATNISRSDILYRELVAEAEKLLTLTKGLKGRTNKDKEKLITQIRELYNKWKD